MKISVTGITEILAGPDSQEKISVSGVTEMGRRSIAEKVCSGIEGSDPKPKKLKLVIYDFAGESIPPRFFDNLKRVFRLMRDGWMLQYSAITARRMSTVLAVAELARHYKCRNVRIYVVEELA